MKRSKQCPKCESLRIGYLASQADADETSTGTYRHVAQTAPPADAGFWWTPKALGSLEASICTDCGYHESYVREPHRLPWEQLRGFAWVNPPSKSEGPFR